MEQTNIRQEILDAVRVALSDATLPVCRLESQKMEEMQKAIATLAIQMSGNGTPERGLIIRTDRLEQTVKDVKTEFETDKKNREDDRKYYTRLVAGMALTYLATFVSMGVYFYIKLTPLMAELSKLP